ncbi:MULTISPECIES: hypothetical protein [unclassified Neisseria]|uniref:hypothetical protein n=1 Tax=unclassified Neisseria TaxID=2623750 RepID=UPI0026651143|nr:MULTISPECIES: hypothetical protein [unclassified Neisseria]MDO1509970.1 hypothetical protein [Neisseria sp. MVDL19-042950]MDO1516170.1 hypothetical protein [Neisseria sp. MVDL18-041461]MDO1563285.1 hypothetical protein [Neisseria sp. MVDL20-010259]
MKELPDSLHNAVVDGLTLLLALRLPGTPAADTVQATAQVWSVALAAGKTWDAEQDIPRIQTAFSLLAAQTDRWPAPRDLLGCLPPRPERLKLEHRHQPTPEQQEKAKAVMAKIQRALATAPCWQKEWIHGPRSRSVEECKRIYEANSQKGKRNG